MDTVGGAMAEWGICGVNTAKERTARINRLATIDMRIDYLKAGRGELFTGNSQLIACWQTNLCDPYGVT